MKNSIRQFIFTLIATLFVSSVFTGCTPSGLKALLQGEALLNENRPKDAVKKLEKAVYHMPNSALAYNHLGLAYHKAGMLNQAYEAYAKALELSPSMEALHYNRACLFYDTTNYTMAIRELNEFLSKTPVIPDKQYIISRAYKKYGLCCLNLRQNENAVICFNNTLALMPNDADTHNTLGYIALSQKNEQTAFEHFQKAIEANTNYPTAYLNCGIIYRKRGGDSNNDAALQYFEKFLSLKPVEYQANTARKLVAQITSEKKIKADMAELRKQNENISNQQVKTNTIKQVQAVQPVEVKTNAIAEITTPKPAITNSLPLQVAQNTTTQPEQQPVVVANNAVTNALEVAAPTAPVTTNVVETDVAATATEEGKNATTALNAEVPEKTIEEAANTKQPLIIDGKEVESLPQEVTEMVKLGSKIEDLDKKLKENNVPPVPSDEATDAEQASDDHSLAAQMEKLQVDLPEGNEDDSLEAEMQKLQVQLPEKELDTESEKTPVSQNTEVKKETTKIEPIKTSTPEKKRGFRLSNIFGSKKNKQVKEEEETPIEEEVPVIPVDEDDEVETTNVDSNAGKDTTSSGAYKGIPRYDRTLPKMPESNSERDSLAIDCFNTATQCYGNRDYKQAIVYFKEAIEKEPSWFEAHKFLATVYLRSGHYEESFGEFKKAIALSPDDWQTHYNFALALNTAGYSLDAVEELSIAEKLSPESPEIYLAMGNIYNQKLDDIPNATEAYKMYVKLAPNSVDKMNVGRWLNAHATK